MFFRNKKRPDDESGLDRISRMIDGRQPDAEDEQGESEFFEDDRVLVAREPREGAPDASRAAASPRRELLPESDDIIEESVTVVRAPEMRSTEGRTVEPRTLEARGAERPLTAPLAPPATVAPAASPAPAETPIFSAPPRELPRMPAPDMSLAAGQAAGASLVAKDAVWDGTLVCSGNVRIEGTLRGEVQTTGTLFVLAEARVEGTVKARNVTLAGEIQGTLRCEEKLEILPGGAARGEVDTGALVVHEGAFIESRFQMRRG